MKNYLLKRELLFLLVLVVMGPLWLRAENQVPLANSQQEKNEKTQNSRHLKRTLAVMDVEHNGKALGKITFILFADKAPKTVENFVGLVEGTKEFKEFSPQKGKVGGLVRRPFYDGLTFHRISPGYVIQGGCPFGTGRGSPGYKLDDEINSELHHDSEGILSMANTGQKNSAGSQFFITLARAPQLDGSYAIFGKVIEGLEVVHKIARVQRNPMTERPIQPVTIKKVTIVREYAK